MRVWELDITLYHMSFSSSSSNAPFHSLESIVGGKSAANEEVRKASMLIKRVEGVIAPYNGKEVDKIVFFALQDVRDTILLLANLIKGTQKSYFVTKMVFGSTITKKLVAASDDLHEALESLITASNIHSNEMLKKRVAEEQAAQEKHMRRQQAILDRKVRSVQPRLLYFPPSCF